MQIVHTRFGDIEVDPDTVLTFPRGLPGFESLTRYKLLHEDKPNPTVLWLQSLDDAEVAFSVVQAELLGINYQIELNDEETALLGLDKPEDAILLLTLAKRDESKNSISANTVAPIILNTKTRKGLQKIGLHADIVFRNGA
ncbi:Flagellar assembly factor FliW [Andreprevotia sp. IGB-42]|uniref:flagellar assembly protein FliW n=1 Tax=Andreprevotia sp. IGB-42 TaxID=2497473 RepID=UPI001356F39C|nr:flagellar assembly protein FliW [Andreprevotia sp. IGB-42]KAF0814437.1 Flagellar assembly factor FliW [Andreprevotia sp. IGB-42]